MTDGQITLSSKTYCLDPGEHFVRVVERKTLADEKSAAEIARAQIKSDVVQVSNFPSHPDVDYHFRPRTSAHDRQAGRTIRRLYPLVPFGLSLLAIISALPIVSIYIADLQSADRPNRL